MTPREIFIAAVKRADTVKISADHVAAMAAQEAINSIGVNIGANPAFGVTAAQDAALKAANTTYTAARLKAADDRRVAIREAEAALRAAGDLGPLGQIFSPGPL